jgi:hypothetical protein
MKKRILQQKVTISGPDFFGRKSSITFLPAENDGWYLETKYHGLVPIDHNIAYSKKGRLQLRSGGTVANVVEHILALRILIGLDRVILIVHCPWLPYLGGAGGYVQQLQEASIQTDEDFKTIAPIRECSLSVHNTLGTRVSIRNHTGNLIVKLRSRWTPLPEYADTVSLEDLAQEVFRQKILTALPQGFPHYRKAVAKVCAFFGWPNMKYVAWQDDFKTPEEAAFGWWAHALQDTCGCLVLCHHQYLPSLFYMRKFAGHREDLLITKKAYSSITK